MARAERHVFVFMVLPNLVKVEFLNLVGASDQEWIRLSIEIVAIGGSGVRYDCLPNSESWDYVILREITDLRVLQHPRLGQILRWKISKVWH